MSTANSNDNSNSSNRGGNFTHTSIANAVSIARAQRSDGQSQSHSLPHLQNRGQSGFSFSQHHPQVQTVQSRRSHLQTPDQLRNPGSGSGSPITGSKRTQQKPPSRPPTNAPVTFKSMEIAPAPCRKRRKLPNGMIPETVRALVPRSELFMNLLELESRIDSSIARKKSELRESLKHSLTLKRTLRVYVFNTFSQGPDNNNEESPCWTLKITGRILCDDDGRKKSRCPNFSYFFSNITVFLDESLYPDDGVIMWERDGSKAKAFPEGLRVRRNGGQEFTAVVELVAHNVPEKFRLSEKLARVLGTEVDTYRGIMAAFWEYVKIKKLQDPHDPSLLICDPPLKEVIGEDRVRFGSVRKKLMEQHHLSTPPLIRLEHRVNLSGGTPTCYDLSVDVPLFSDMAEETLEMVQEIDAFDQRISAASEKLYDHSVRHAFFSGFSESPSEFINALLRSQSKDLNIAYGDAVRDEETEARPDFYREPWVDDAVVRYVARRPCPNAPERR